MCLLCGHSLGGGCTCIFLPQSVAPPPPARTKTLQSLSDGREGAFHTFHCLPQREISQGNRRVAEEMGRHVMEGKNKRRMICTIKTVICNLHESSKYEK